MRVNNLFSASPPPPLPLGPLCVMRSDAPLTVRKPPRLGGHRELGQFENARRRARRDAA